MTLAGYQVETSTGVQPRSIRSGGFSASNDTYRVVYELGFRQGSLSNPGQHRARYGSDWADAPPDAHYVDSANRLISGAMPFLELPPTVDATKLVRGLPWEMRIENGTAEDWLKPLAESQLARMEADNVVFRALCIGSRNGIDYHEKNNFTDTIDEMIDYIDQLSESYEIVPVTMAGAHDHFRRMH